jgi:hypothetical protein
MCGHYGYCGTYRKDLVIIRVVEILVDENGRVVAGPGYYNSRTGEFSFSAAALRDFRADRENQLVGAGVFAHEIKHQQQGLLGQPSMLAEHEAYSTQYNVYQALEIDESANQNPYVSNSRDLGHDVAQMPRTIMKVERFENSPYAGTPIYKLSGFADWANNFVRGIVSLWPW